MADAGEKVTTDSTPQESKKSRKTDAKSETTTTSTTSTAESNAPRLNDDVTALILQQVPFKELAPLRLMCRQWNRAITETVLRNSLQKLEIYFISGRKCYHRAHYVLTPNDIEGLRTILGRHSCIHTLKLTSLDESSEVNPLNFGDLIAEWKNLWCLRQLVLVNFEMNEASVLSLQHLPSLDTITFDRCNLTGKHLDLLSSSIRSLKFYYCNALRKEFLLAALQAFHSRRIPFESLELLGIAWQGPNLSIKFCLENFASLQKLRLFAAMDIPANLEAVVATNLQCLRLQPSYRDTAAQDDIFQRLCQQLFRHRLPQLRELKLEQINTEVLRQCLDSCSPQCLEILEVKISESNCRTEDFFERLLQFSKLKRLRIPIWPWFTLTHIVAMVRHLPHLTFAYLGRLREASPAEVHRFGEELQEALSHQPEVYNGCFLFHHVEKLYATALDQLPYIKVTYPGRKLAFVNVNKRPNQDNTSDQQ